MRLSEAVDALGTQPPNDRNGWAYQNWLKRRGDAIEFLEQFEADVRQLLPTSQL